MRPINHDNCPGEVPHVAMTREEAAHLFLAVDHARKALVAEIRGVERSRFMSDSYKASRVALLRDHLDYLAQFAAAHGEAHGIGGY